MNANLVSVWREAWRPPDRRPPWAWAEQHIGSIAYSPIPGRFRSDNSPQIREPLEALIDPRVRLVFIIAAIQSGKTSVGELFRVLLGNVGLSSRSSLVVRWHL